MKSQNITYLPAIDQLRGIAALGIVFYHGTQVYHDAMTGKPAVWRAARNPFDAFVVEGHTSVALFMVLSGFIFTYGAWGRSVDVRAFLRNRFLRTYPLFLFFVALGLAAYPNRVTFPETLMTIFGLANFPHALDMAPFSGMFWAVAVEWQFYLIFPALLHAFQSRGTRFVLGLLALLLLARWIAVGAGTNPRYLAYMTIVGRLDQFAVGMLLGRRLHAAPLGRAWRWLFPVAVGAVLAVTTIQNRLGGWPDVRSYRIVWTTLEGGVWALFVGCFLALAPRMPRLIAWPLGRLGLVSYSVYLWHYPLLDTFRHHNISINRGGPIMASYLSTLIILLPVTFGVSLLSYQIIEKPFLEMRRRYLGRETMTESRTAA